MPTRSQPAEQLERLVQASAARARPRAARRGSVRAPARSRAVADLEQVVRVGDHERPVVQLEHVELDQVAAQLDRPDERAQRVLGLEGGGALVADAQRPAVGSDARRKRIRDRRLSVPDRGDRSRIPPMAEPAQRQRARVGRASGRPARRRPRIPLLPGTAPRQGRAPAGDEDGARPLLGVPRASSSSPARSSPSPCGARSPGSSASKRPTYSACGTPTSSTSTIPSRTSPEQPAGSSRAAAAAAPARRRDLVGRRTHRLGRRADPACSPRSCPGTRAARSRARRCR